jgi:hypothetical protein
MAKGERDITSAAYTITDWTSDRALDCDTDTDNAIADVLGTLIGDLIDQGILTGTVST